MLVIHHQDTQVRLVNGTAALDCAAVILPFFGIDFDVGVRELLMLTHRVLVNKLNPQGLRLAVRHTCPYAELILCVLLQSDTEITFVLQTRPHITVSCARQVNIVWVLVERSVVLHLHLAEGVPAHKMVGRELE